jgi:squalene-hopene/tetraprenyl-beta-curcumene cyclase
MSRQFDVAVADVVAAAQDDLLAGQEPDGSWAGETRTNVIAEAVELLVGHWVGLHVRDQIERSANWIRSQQQPDGSWPAYHGGPGHLAASVLSYAALRLAGDPAETSQQRRAAGWIRQAGGLQAVPTVPTMPPLALLGLWPWDRTPVLPPEMALLPRWFPLHIDKLIGLNASLVGTATYMHFRPTRPVGFSLAELVSPDHPQPAAGRRLAVRELGRGPAEPAGRPRPCAATV